MSQIDDVLNVARSQLGYTESPAGSNMQKYGAEYGWNGVAWCSQFQWWIFKHAGLEGLYPKTASTRVSYPWFKQRGLIRPSKLNGQPGDVIWYDFGTPDPVNHVGIIEKRLGAGHYQTIEGNSQPLWAKVLTPTGWVKMGDLQVGDEVVDPSGEKSFVTDIYPQGIEEVFRITLADGSVTHASMGHLWRIVTTPHENLEVVPTQFLKERLEKSGTARCFVPPMQPVEGRVPATMDAYALGLLLGDGTLPKKGSVKFTTADPELFDAVVASVPGLSAIHYPPYDYAITSTTHRNPLRDKLGELGVLGHTAASKRIPDVCMTWSSDDRLALLQGLMDSDGYADGHGRGYFNSVSLALAEGVRDLIRSLGGRACVTTKQPAIYTSPTQHEPKRLDHASYQVAVSLPVNVFRLERKAKRYSVDRKQRRGYRIVSVESDGWDQTQCIRVSASSHLYVTDDYIPTHNTSPTSQSNGGAVMRRDRSGSTIVAVGTPQYATVMPMRRMYDAAFPPTSPPNVEAVAGYIGGGTPHIWTDAEWASQMTKASAKYKLPIFVRGSLSSAQSHDPVADANWCADWAEAHGQPHGTLIALDYETTIYAPYLNAFDDQLNKRGYKCVVYGSRSFVVQNPEPSGGYWTATWNNVAHLDTGAAITQYGGDTTLGQPWDINVVADSTPLWGGTQEVTFLMALTDAEQDEVLQAARQINHAVGFGQTSFEKTIEAILSTVQTLVNEGRSQASNIIAAGQASDSQVQAAVLGYLTAHPSTVSLSDADKQSLVSGVVSAFQAHGVPVDAGALLDALNARLAA